MARSSGSEQGGPWSLKDKVLMPSRTTVYSFQDDSHYKTGLWKQVTHTCPPPSCTSFLSLSVLLPHSVCSTLYLWFHFPIYIPPIAPKSWNTHIRASLQTPLPRSNTPRLTSLPGSRMTHPLIQPTIDQGHFLKNNSLHINHVHSFLLVIL